MLCNICKVYKCYKSIFSPIICKGYIPCCDLIITKITCSFVLNRSDVYALISFTLFYKSSKQFSRSLLQPYYIYIYKKN